MIQEILERLINCSRLFFNLSKQYSVPYRVSPDALSFNAMVIILSSPKGYTQWYVVCLYRDVLLAVCKRVVFNPL